MMFSRVKFPCLFSFFHFQKHLLGCNKQGKINCPSTAFVGKICRFLSFHSNLSEFSQAYVRWRFYFFSHEKREEKHELVSSWTMMANKWVSVAVHLKSASFVGQLSLKKSLAAISLKYPFKYSWEMGHLPSYNMETFNHICAGVSLHVCN